MVTYTTISPKNGEPQRYSRGTQKKKKNTNFSGLVWPNDHKFSEEHILLEKSR